MDKSTVYLPLTVSASISLKPYVTQLPISIQACGNPVLTPMPCGKYILTQDLYAKVPIEIDIKSKIDKPYPHCSNPPTKCHSWR